MYNNGFLKVAAITPEVYLAKPLKNVEKILEILIGIEANLAVFPELSITGYSLEDLLYSNKLLTETNQAIKYFLDKNKFQGIVVVGSPLTVEGILYNVAIVIRKDKILGIVPKIILPHTHEFNEKRWFNDGTNINQEIEFLGQTVLFGSNVFASEHFNFGVEICADMWGPYNPSSYLYLSGAEVVVNISASTENLNKNKVRRTLVNAVTIRHSAAYVYCSSGVNESSSTVLYGGDKFVYQAGNLVAEKQDYSFDTEILYADIDISSIRYNKRKNGYIKDSKKIAQLNIKNIRFKNLKKDFSLESKMDLTPFVPKIDIGGNFKQITNIQTRSLIKRMRAIDIKTVVIGISGGLDSTLALLQIVKAFKDFNYQLKNVIAVTMPSHPTSERTRKNAELLAKKLGVIFIENPIGNLVDQQLKLIAHSEKDVTYENVQSRIRTNILLSYANKYHGIVVGTGDMTEMALGWCTFAGDQIAHYSLNAGLPKTTVRFMVSQYAKNNNLKELLLDIINTPISPELLENQVTEDTIGSYEVNDFILYRLLKDGDSMERIISFIPDEEKTVRAFFDRFYKNQFKRSTMPEGVKILFAALSSKTDLRIPGDL